MSGSRTDRTVLGRTELWEQSNTQTRTPNGHRCVHLKVTDSAHTRTCGKLHEVCMHRTKSGRLVTGYPSLFLAFVHCTCTQTGCDAIQLMYVQRTLERLPEQATIIAPSPGVLNVLH